jgi:hypothetical protein
VLRSSEILGLYIPGERNALNENNDSQSEAKISRKEAKKQSYQAKSRTEKRIIGYH